MTMVLEKGKQPSYRQEWSPLHLSMLVLLHSHGEICKFCMHCNDMKDVAKFAELSGILSLCVACIQLVI